MTCIVGMVDKKTGTVCIGADSCGADTQQYTVEVREDSKVFVNGPFIMGFTTSFRMGQLLRFSLKAPDQTAKQDTYEFMVTTFVDTVRTCLKDGGYASKNNEVESGGQFLVGYRGRLFEIHSDYQVAEQSRGFTAIGCGYAYALGALAVTTNIKSAHTRVRSALHAAETFSAYVSRPFIIKTLKRRNE